LVKVIGEEKIEECYQVVENDQRPDNHLKRWINVIIQQIRQPNTSGSFRNTRVTNDENFNTANTNSLQAGRDKQRVQSNDLSELQRIVQKINYIKTDQEYSMVIQELYDGITKNNNVNINELLKDINDSLKKKM